MIPEHIQALLKAWIANNEWVEEKPALKEELLLAVVQLCADRDTREGSYIVAQYVLERINYVEAN